MRHLLAPLAAAFLLAAPPLAFAAPAPEPAIFRRADGAPLSPDRIDDEIQRLMRQEAIPGLALALIDRGTVVYVRTFGVRDVRTGQALQRDTVMYGASLTKAAFAYMCLQLVDEGRLDLDAPIERYLPKPLPEYPQYADLAADPRWRRFTPRMLLSHTTGMPNFRWINPDEKLDIKFEPGSRYVYSGEGFNLMQFVLEEGLKLDVGAEMQRRVFARFGMERTSMTWRADFAENNASGHDEAGVAVGHNIRENVRAAGSMDTTIDDYARFLAGVWRGDGLSRSAKRELLGPQIAIVSKAKFPSHAPENAPGDANARVGLSYGLGWGRWISPYGPVWFKGGNGSGATNLSLCVERTGTCLVVLTNSARGRDSFCPLVRSLLGDLQMPCDWLGLKTSD